MTHEQNLKYLLSRSDVESALTYLNAIDDKEVAEKFQNYITKYWPSMFGSYNEVYKEAGKIEAMNTEVIHSVVRETRYQVLKDFLNRNNYLQTIYNYGASRCLYDINLCNELGRKWYCTDIDTTSIIEAKKYIDKYAKYPDSITVQVEDEYFGNDDTYDCCICMEVIEHVIDPIRLLNKLEDSVKPGGQMFISVPYGPVEYTMWIDSPHRIREHIREFNESLLFDLFKGKKDLKIGRLSYGKSKYLDEDVGCHFVIYTVGENRGFTDYTIDVNKKLVNVKDVMLPGL